MNWKSLVLLLRGSSWRCRLRDGKSGTTFWCSFMDLLDLYWVERDWSSSGFRPIGPANEIFLLRIPPSFMYYSSCWHIEFCLIRVGCTSSFSICLSSFRESSSFKNLWFRSSMHEGLFSGWSWKIWTKKSLKSSGNELGRRNFFRSLKKFLI